MTRNPIGLLELAHEISAAKANGCDQGICTCGESEDCLAKGWEKFAPQPTQPEQPAQPHPGSGKLTQQRCSDRSVHARPFGLGLALLCAWLGWVRVVATLRSLLRL